MPKTADEVYELLEQGKTIQEIAAAEGLKGERQIQRRLKQGGYVYGQKERKWKPSPGSNSDMTTGNTGVSLPFTESEVAAIKAMIAEREAAATADSNTVIPLYDRIREIDRSKREAKTVKMSGEVAGRLDAFCERNRISKSDALTLALADFLTRYE